MSEETERYVRIDCQRFKTVQDALGLTNAHLAQDASLSTIEQLRAKGTIEKVVEFSKAVKIAKRLYIAPEDLETRPVFEFRMTENAIERRAPSAWLAERWTEALRGGACVVVKGEWGAGKSTVIQQFVRSVRSAPDDQPYVAWISDPSHTELLRALVVDRLCGTYPEVKALAQRQANLRNPWFASRASTGDQLQEVRSAQGERELIEALHQIIRCAAKIRPVLLIVEGFDQVSVDGLARKVLLNLVRQLHPLRLMVLLEVRDQPESEAGRGLPTVVEEQEANAAVLRVNPMNSEEVDAFLKGRLDTFPVSDETIGSVLCATGGNPLLLSTLMRDALDHLKAGKGASADEVISRELQHTKSGMRAVIRTWLSRVPSVDAALLQYGAMEGIRFHSRTVALALQNADYVPDAQVREVEQRLDDVSSRYGIIGRDQQVPGTGAAPFGARYRFHHALFRDGTIATANAAEQRAKSRAVYQALARVFQAELDCRAGQLAELCETGELFAEAGSWYRKEVAQLVAIFEDSQAQVRCRRGIRCLELLSEKTASAVSNEVSLRTTWAAIQTTLIGFTARDAYEEYAKAHALGSQLKDREGDSLFPILWGRWVYHLVSADMKRALEYGHEMVSLANASQSVNGLVEGLAALGLTQVFAGHYSAAAESLEAGLSLYSTDGVAFHSLYLRLDPKVNMLCLKARLETDMGLFDGAAVTTKQAIRHAEELRHPYSLAFAKMFAAYTYQFIGKADLALLLARESADESQDRFPQVFAWAAICLGWAEALGENSIKGLESMSRGIDALRRENARIVLHQFLEMRAEGFLHSGNVEAALSDFDEAEKEARETGNQDHLSGIYRKRGELKAALGRYEQAAKDFDSAFRVGESQGSIRYSLQAALSHARCLPKDSLGWKRLRSELAKAQAIPGFAESIRQEAAGVLMQQPVSGA